MEKKIYIIRKRALKKHNVIEAFNYFINLAEKLIRKEGAKDEHEKKNSYKNYNNNHSNYSKNNNTYTAKKEKSLDFSNFVFYSDSNLNKTLINNIENAMKPNLYQRFGCNMSSSKDEIKQQYRKRSLILHPDKHMCLSVEFKIVLTEAFKNLSVAYEKLSQ